MDIEVITFEPEYVTSLLYWTAGAFVFSVYLGSRLHRRLKKRGLGWSLPNLLAFFLEGFNVEKEGMDRGDFAFVIFFVPILPLMIVGNIFAPDHRLEFHKEEIIEYKPFPFSDKKVFPLIELSEIKVSDGNWDFIYIDGESLRATGDIWNKNKNKIDKLIGEALKNKGTSH